jgi:uncharacterized protein (TIGR03000 family)
VRGEGVVTGRAAASLVVLVPKDAVVFINGKPTASTGTRREYFSEGLLFGHDYRYVVRAKFPRDGKIAEETCEALLRAGESSTLSLGPSGRQGAKTPPSVAGQASGS